ncbi:hypothetical protein RHMOL_Rhmol02G0232700 [Rhododendron molle]|uniref:Uncharacterized protein n=1 Tax=Rhododendron molle TaxID=49168 RepID=A0ACC0PTP4_RHOML|nr:hypothetical protein RHMOL_Rhmol02G0232700 [Rhododendron molle]
MSVVNLLNSVTTDHHLYNLITICRSLLQELGQPPVRHTLHESNNKCADLLAKDGREHLFPYLLYLSVPFCRRN